MLGMEEAEMRTSRLSSATAVTFAAVLFAFVAASPYAQSSDFPPVTDAMLQDPAPGDWLMWRRTLNGWGYVRWTRSTATTSDNSG